MNKKYYPVIVGIFAGGTSLAAHPALFVAALLVTVIASFLDDED